MVRWLVVVGKLVDWLVGGDDDDDEDVWITNMKDGEL